MKHLLYLFLLFSLIACSGDKESAETQAAANGGIQFAELEVPEALEQAKKSQNILLLDFYSDT